VKSEKNNPDIQTRRRNEIILKRDEEIKGRYVTEPYLRDENKGIII
jgi:hypothetical protein